MKTMGWDLRTITIKGDYLIIPVDDGTVQVKLDADGVVVDIYDPSQMTCLSTCGAEYSELQLQKES